MSMTGTICISLTTLYWCCEFGLNGTKCTLDHTSYSIPNLHHLYVTVYMDHYDDVIMSAIASQITSLTIVYSTVYSDADQRKHQSSVSLAFVWGIHRWIPRTNGQLRGKCFHLMTSSCVIPPSLGIFWEKQIQINSRPNYAYCTLWRRICSKYVIAKIDCNILTSTRVVYCRKLRASSQMSALMEIIGSYS